MRCVVLPKISVRWSGGKSRRSRGLHPWGGVSWCVSTKEEWDLPFVARFSTLFMFFHFRVRWSLSDQSSTHLSSSCTAHLEKVVSFWWSIKSHAAVCQKLLVLVSLAANGSLHESSSRASGDEDHLSYAVTWEEVAETGRGQDKRGKWWAAGRGQGMLGRLKEKREEGKHNWGCQRATCTLLFQSLCNVIYAAYWCRPESHFSSVSAFLSLSWFHLLRSYDLHNIMPV